jgi:D-alanyl-D-alanine endopeptidase (penicillin-binding protein 7)
VNNLAAICIVAFMLAWSGAPDAAQNTKDSKTAKPGVSAKNGGKRVAVSYKKDGAKTVKKAAASAAAAAAAVSAAEVSGTMAAHGPDLKSSNALVFDVSDGTVLYGKNTSHVSAIASITKLMTAMVVLDADLPLEEAIRIDKADIDTLKHTGSRLRIGSVFTRRDLLHMALMSSENRAASALGRSYPGGTDQFVARMNEKAYELGMRRSRFAEPTGLSSQNVSTAEDLALLVQASLDYPLIREFTTTASAQIHTADTGHAYGFSNSNGLVRTSTWQIDVSKTGYISEAGQCLVMQARIRDRPIIIVLLDSWGKYTRIGDANRIKKWLESKELLAGHSS